MRLARLPAVLLAAALLAPPTPADAEPSPEKVELIRELLELSGGEEATQQITDTMLGQIYAAFPTLVEEVLRAETELEEAQREALRAHLADFDSFALTFRTRLPKRIDLGEVLETVYVPLYDANFSEAELREIVRFYATPTGRKVVEVLPRVLQEGMESTVPLVQPVVMNLLGEILAERRVELIR
ncbi:MAG: DUF2059 domain-containing protein [Myxococcota bacterium]|nr:DUF2059 domain-containing protein [Myxococcota bacterium]